MTKLRPFQEEGVRAIYSFKGRALLADEQGLGKTIQALTWIHRIKSCRPAIIIAPASMKYTWQAEAGLHFNMRVDVLEGTKPRVDKLPSDIVVLNYDILEGWLPVIMKTPPAVIVFDEIHYLKNPAAMRSKAAKRLIKNARSVVGLSGTPVINRPMEIWFPLHLIKPELFPEQFKFGFRYCRPKMTQWGWDFSGSSREKELNGILEEKVMIRRMKSEVAKELPPKIRKTIFLKLKPADYREYEKVRGKDFLTWLKKEKGHARAKRAEKSLYLTKVGYLLRYTIEKKLPSTLKWIQEFLDDHPDKKLVCFTMHTKVIDAVVNKFPGAVVIDGRVTGKKREQAKRAFQTSDRHRLLVGNWIAAGVGLTLTAAHNLVGLDLPWSSGDLLQGEDRIHRIGQTKSAFIYYLIAMDTIEEKQMDLLKRKAGILGAVLNGEGSKEDLNIFDELMKELI